MTSLISFLSSLGFFHVHQRRSYHVVVNKDWILLVCSTEQTFRSMSLNVLFLLITTVTNETKMSIMFLFHLRTVSSIVLDLAP